MTSGRWNLLLFSVSLPFLLFLTTFSAVFLENGLKTSKLDISASRADRDVKPSANESSWEGLSSDLGEVEPRVRLRVGVVAPSLLVDRSTTAWIWMWSEVM